MRWDEYKPRQAVAQRLAAEFGGPITTPEGVTYEIDWDGDGTDFVPAEDTLRWWER